MLTKNAYVADGTYYVHDSIKSFTPNWTPSIAEANCPTTRKCYVWNAANDAWETAGGANTLGCNTGAATHFTNNFDSNSKGEYKVYISKTNW